MPLLPAHCLLAARITTVIGSRGSEIGRRSRANIATLSHAPAEQHSGFACCRSASAKSPIHLVFRNARPPDPESLAMPQCRTATLGQLRRPSCSVSARLPRCPETNYCRRVAILDGDPIVVWLSARPDCHGSQGAKNAEEERGEKARSARCHCAHSCYWVEAGCGPKHENASMPKEVPPPDRRAPTDTCLTTAPHQRHHYLPEWPKRLELLCLLR